MSLLDDYRVLDLTDASGWVCGKLLADLGAEVIKIERPGGDPGRSIGPYHHHVPTPNNGLYWLAFNTNKRGITLDIEAPAGQEIFKRLVDKSDFVVESFRPGYLHGLGLGYEDLHALKPSLILTSITPFGQNGPLSGYKGSNMIAEAMGGLSYITGNAEGRPVTTSYHYAYTHAGLQAATGSLVANHWRCRTGEGQHVDVSIQEAVLVTLYVPQQLWYDQQVIQRRYGTKVLRAKDVLARQVYPCKDGYVMWRLMTGGFAKRLQPLIDWMVEEGKAEGLNDIDWQSVDLGKTSQEQQDTWERIFAKFLLTKTRNDLYVEALKRGFMLFPVNDVADILHDPQLEARGFWRNVAYPDLGATLAHPGFPYSITGVSLELRKAPSVGEHNEEIYCHELGYSRKQLSSLKKDRVI